MITLGLYLVATVLTAFSMNFIRRHVLESPRWLMVHGRFREADEVIDMIEREVMSARLLWRLPESSRSSLASRLSASRSNPSRRRSPQQIAPRKAQPLSCSTAWRSVVTYEVPETDYWSGTADCDGEGVSMIGDALAVSLCRIRLRRLTERNDAVAGNLSPDIPAPVRRLQEPIDSAHNAAHNAVCNVMRNATRNPMKCMHVKRATIHVS